jgi:hypothetical protein
MTWRAARRTGGRERRKAGRSIERPAAAAFLAGGKGLVVAPTEGTIRVWELNPKVLSFRRFQSLFAFSVGRTARHFVF